MRAARVWASRGASGEHVSSSAPESGSGPDLGYEDLASVPLAEGQAYVSSRAFGAGRIVVYDMHPLLAWMGDGMGRLSHLARSVDEDDR